MRDHAIDWENPAILDRANKTAVRRVKEALWIAATPEAMNKDSSVDLSGLWVDLCRPAGTSGK